MAIRDIILTLKNKEGTLTNNRVCNFAYDDTAFNDDTSTGANGVVAYNYNNHNNIPVKDNTIIKVNPTVTAKGFRSLVSNLPRMFLNHIFGRVSYNLNKTVDTLNETLTALYNAIGQANGLATLDNTGRLPYSQLPISAVEYKGAWNASTNTPALSAGSGTFGDEYIVSVEGTRDLGEGSITYRVGDRVIYNGSIWQRIPSSSVRSVNTKTPDANGNVTVNAEDIATPDVYGYDKQGQGFYWDKGNSAVSLAQIVEGNGVFVGCGQYGVPDTSTGLWYSEDGTNWTQSNVTGGTAQSRNTCIYFANGLFVAGLKDDNSNTSSTYWSEDGKTWTAVATSAVYYISQVTFIKETQTWFICCGDWLASSDHSSLLFSSKDGKTWTLVKQFYDTRYVHAITYGNEKYVVCSGNGFYISADLTTWTTAGSSLYITWYDITCINNTFIAVGSGAGAGKIYTSLNGTSWSQSYSGSIYLNRLKYVNNKLFAIAGSNNNLLYSTNGGTIWATATVAPTSYLVLDIDYIRGLYCTATGDGVYYSSELSTWYKAEINNSQFSAIRAIVYARGLWVAVGVGNYYSAGNLTNNVKTILDWLIYAVDNMLD